MALGKFSVFRSIAALLRSADVASASLARDYCTASHTGVSRRTLQETAVDWRYWTASSAATVTLIAWMQAQEGPAHCLTEPTKDEDHVTEKSSFMLRQWLDSVGADVDAIDVQECTERPDAGLGVFASREVQKTLQVSWKRPYYRFCKPNDGIVLASFPLQAAITRQTILSDPVLGQTYKELLDIGVIDERMLIILFLTIERQLGVDSVWYPWLKLLPVKPQTPLFYSDIEMTELRGTSLEHSARLQKRGLAEQWKRLEPACQDLLKKAGASTTQVSFDDFMWAHAMFWSRSQSFPRWTQEAGEMVVSAEEGMVPGLDFCNHKEHSTAKWTIFGTPGLEVDESGQPTAMPTQVALVCPRQQAPAPGQEITIDYGDKSNEQLLLNYGFAQPNNMNDVLTIMCPVSPPEDRDDILTARLNLLLSRGLMPRLFLPAKLLDGRPTRTGKDRSLRLPEEVEEILKIFVMVPKQLRAEVVSELDPEPAQNTLDAVEESGERMAVLTTLVGLLELKHLQLEGESGTGSLEADMKLIEAEANKEGDRIPDAKWACLVYRSSQKRIAREYLIRARKELAAEMNRMRALQQSQ
ncbi:MAG: hypothetical protein FRX49_07674 [Trebouxia sp. A1-2]|nr:MAG: hypothetical protein FRX49_07674 [Trebouxia sp. A1-2]